MSLADRIPEIRRAAESKSLSLAEETRQFRLDWKRRINEQYGPVLEQLGASILLSEFADLNLKAVAGTTTVETEPTVILAEEILKRADEVYREKPPALGAAIAHPSGRIFGASGGKEYVPELIDLGAVWQDRLFEDSELKPSRIGVALQIPRTEGAPMVFAYYAWGFRSLLDAEAAQRVSDRNYNSDKIPSQSVLRTTSSRIVKSDTIEQSRSQLETSFAELCVRNDLLPALGR